MYTGITKGLFPIIQIDKKPGLLTYVVELNEALSQNIQIGDSISIDGACQTVTHIHEHQITFQAMAETLVKTTLGDLDVGKKVSVERSARIGDENGGHDLAGHIFERAHISARDASEDNLTLTIQCSQKAISYLFEKGFVGLDGSSLTVTHVSKQNATFQVHLIPETIRRTNFGNKKTGDFVNLELDAKAVIIVDSLAHYLEPLEARIAKLENSLR